VNEVKKEEDVNKREKKLAVLRGKRDVGPTKVYAPTLAEDTLGATFALATLFLN
jgi:hypothetical protein